MKYDLSIIIPAYNCEETIRDCLTSIYNQRKSDDFETIVINDGSNDATAEIVNEMRKEHSNLRHIYQDNAGVSAARNHGIDIANGKYLTFVDSDDMVGVDMAQMMPLINITQSRTPLGNMEMTHGHFHDIRTTPTFEQNFFTRMLSIAHRYDADVAMAGKLTINRARGYVRTHEYKYSIAGNGVPEKEMLLKQAEERESANFALYSNRILNGKSKLRFIEKMHLDEDMLFCMQSILRADYVATVPSSMYLYNRHDNTLSNIHDINARNNKYSLANIRRFSVLLKELATMPEYKTAFTYWLRHFSCLGEDALMAGVETVHEYPTTCHTCPHTTCDECWYLPSIIQRLDHNVKRYLPKYTGR